MGKIFVLCGKSSSGKDTIYKIVKEKMSLIPVVSHTSRPMRPCETEGVEYYFVSKEDFLEMESKSEFVETRVYNTLLNGEKDTWYYGVSKQAINLDKGNHIVITDLNGLADLCKEYKNNVIAIYIEVNDEERERRARIRGGFSEEEWKRRLEDDNKAFNERAISSVVEYTVQNNNLEDSVVRVVDIIKKREL